MLKMLWNWFFGSPLRSIIMINADIKLIAVYSSNMIKKTGLRIREVKKPLFHGSQGFIVFFDKSSYASFGNVEDAYKTGINLIERDLPGCLLGLKADYDVIPFEEGKTKAIELDLPYCESRPGEELLQNLQNLGQEWDDYYNETFRFKEYFAGLKEKYHG